jgi:hypothetical protein
LQCGRKRCLVLLAIKFWVERKGGWKVRKAGRVICSKRSMACVPSVLALKFQPRGSRDANHCERFRFAVSRPPYSSSGWRIYNVQPDVILTHCYLSESFFTGDMAQRLLPASIRSTAARITQQRLRPRFDLAQSAIRDQRWRIVIR